MKYGNHNSYTTEKESVNEPVQFSKRTYVAPYVQTLKLQATATKGSQPSESSKQHRDQIIGSNGS